MNIAKTEHISLEISVNKGEGVTKPFVVVDSFGNSIHSYMHLRVFTPSDYRRIADELEAAIAAYEKRKDDAS